VLQIGKAKDLSAALRIQSGPEFVPHSDLYKLAPRDSVLLKKFFFTLMLLLENFLIIKTIY
jgi:hypothetical protein